MRLFVFVLSIALIVSTTYAHAIVWLPAVSGAVVRTAAGHYIKVASKKALAGSLFVVGGYGANFAANYCKKNKEKCKNILGDTVEYFFDDDETNDHDYYTCQVLGYNSTPSKVAKYYCDNYKGGHVSHSIVQNNNVATLKAVCKRETVNIHCSKNSDNTPEQLAKKIAEHLSDDDIDYIINNYSKEIEINIDKYCATAGACAELEQAFGDEVMNNKNKYDIDRINKDNCEVKNDKIISCDNAKIDKDDDDSDTPKDGDDGQDGQDGDDTKPKDKDKPIKCDSSPFHKKVCDFIDWYYSDEYTQSDTKIDVQDDTPKPTNTNIDFSGSCPASYVVSHTLHFGMLGSYDLEFTLLDTPKLCGFLNDWIKPIMMFLGPLHAVYIIGKRDE